jgi:pantoate--beta-alanine ligase
VIQSVAEMRREGRLARVHERRIALVPTMGYLHEGHLSLVRAAREIADQVVVSIFVNPIQFGPKEDLARYPRDFGGDLEKAGSAGADIVFAPTVEEMFPDGFQTFVEVRELSKGLCGDRRPGHFSGVATVVAKLFNIVQPEAACFGDKDYQQLQVIRRMVRDLEVPVAVVGLPIVREPDGLAMSSRNAYLSADERARALVLSRTLFATRDLFASGERAAEALLGHASSFFQRSLPPGELPRLDYLELRDAETLAPVAGTVRAPAVLAVAAFVGNTRLIDNVQLGVER